jgi:hypothetical protein
MNSLARRPNGFFPDIRADYHVAFCTADQLFNITSCYILTAGKEPIFTTYTTVRESA